MSDSVETRLVTLLNNHTVCPHGNPIPGLEELGDGAEAGQESGLPEDEAVSPMAELAGPRDIPVVVRRISEQVQSDAAVMLKLKQVGIQPGREVTLAASDDGVRVTGDGDANDNPAELPRDVAAHVFVSKR